MNDHCRSLAKDNCCPKVSSLTMGEKDAVDACYCERGCVTLSPFLVIAEQTEFKMLLWYIMTLGVNSRTCVFIHWTMARGRIFQQLQPKKIRFRTMKMTINGGEYYATSPERAIKLRKIPENFAAVFRISLNWSLQLHGSTTWHSLINIFCDPDVSICVQPLHHFTFVTFPPKRAEKHRSSC